MPCFKGLAVSIHTPSGPLPEYAVQKASRLSRISTYIPVPPPSIPPNSTSTKPEPSTFAISITLLTPGQDVPYSTPKKSAQNPNPRPRVVGALPGHADGGPGDDAHRRLVGSIGPYVPLTTSPNETIAAYIYFDGRSKEEVATLLRKGEETWVNSRWVSVPEAEGGGLAEREFLFREVGLERWLNGLDLEGKDAAATIQRRRQKLEKRRRKRKGSTVSDDDDDDDDDNDDRNINDLAKAATPASVKTPRRKSTMKYGPDGELENLSDELDDDDDDAVVDSSSLSSASSEDDDPIPEAAGQIKIALFRVIASGEIKRGEYSPQFDAHDDDEDSSSGGGGGGGGGSSSSANGHANGESKADVDHTTSFAKPKSLDPKTISTQTVTGIDPTDKPYAVFTFFYRGERQLQKMGILQPKSDKPVPNSKRRSLIGEMPKLTPLKKHGGAGFSGFRDAAQTAKAARRGKAADNDDAMESDSDDDDDGGGGGASSSNNPRGSSSSSSNNHRHGSGSGANILSKMEDANDDDEADTPRDPGLLSPEDAERTGQVAEGIRKIKLKRQHSAEPLASNGSAEPRKTSKSGSRSASPTATPSLNSSGHDNTISNNSTSTNSTLGGSDLSQAVPAASGETARQDDDFMLGSPLKKQRSSVADFDDDFKRRLQRGLAAGIGQVLGSGAGSSAGAGAGAGAGLAAAAAKPGATGLKFGGSLGNTKAADVDASEDDAEL